MTAIPVPTSALGVSLEPSDLRQALREQIAPPLREVNQKIKEGWRVVGVDYVLYPDERGMMLSFMMEPPAGS
jgi:hypothetical protein